MDSEKVQMEVKALTEEQEKVIEEKLEEQKVEDYVAFDINLLADGKTIQPQVPVKVTFENAELGEKDNVTLTGFQWDEKEKHLQSIAGSLEDNGDAVVEAEHFTITGAFISEEEKVPENVTLVEGDGTGGTDGSILDKNPEWLQYLGDETSNKWQIVDGMYQGNDPNNKTTYSQEGDVRVQKNVIPTKVENEFLVYLSIDTKQTFQEYFEMAQYKGTEPSNYNPGEIADLGGNKNIEVTADSSKGYEAHAFFNIYDPDGNLIAENIALYWNYSNNFTIFVELEGGKTLVLAAGIKKQDIGKTFEIHLTPEAYELVREELTKAVQLQSIEDQMGEYIEFEEVVAYDSDEKPSYNEGNRTLTWTPKVKENPETIEEVKEVDGKTITTTWRLNVAELVYRVRLNVEKENFNSCANNMSSEVEDDESYVVNTKATLHYNNGKTVDFQVPYVRGLLYDVEFYKKDEEGKKLAGAEFSISGKYFGEEIIRTAVSQSDGSVKIKGIPWGTYQLKETNPPEGYQSDYVGEEVSMCYTANRSSVRENHTEGHEADAVEDITRFLYNGNINKTNAIINKKATTSVSVKKEWDLPNDSYTHPDEVTVELIAKVGGVTVTLPEGIIIEVRLSASVLYR